jgi:hypothetical protein
MTARSDNPSTSTLLLVVGGAAALYFLMSGGPQVIPPVRVLQIQRNLNRFWDSEHQLPVTGVYDLATANRVHTFGVWAFAALQDAIKNDPTGPYYFLGQTIGALDNTKTKEILKFAVSGTKQTMTMTRSFYDYISTNNISEGGCNDRSCHFSIADYYAFRDTVATGGPGAEVN